jgi:hypothetical protein
MSLIFMSALDDYAIASLSYGHVEPDVIGQSFTLTQFVNFLQWYYFNWGGRIVFHGLMILMLKNIWVYRIIQSLAVFIAFFVLHRLAAEEKGNAKTVLLCCSLYGTFSFEMFRAGFYWFSASSIYVLPLPFLCIGILVMRYLESKTENRVFLIALGSLCFLLFGVSQEQNAVTLLVLMFALCFYDYLDKKSVRLYRLPFFAASILGSGFLLLAPGNFARFQLNEHTQIKRIAINMVFMAAGHLRQENIVFLLLLVGFIFYISYVLYKAGRINKVVYLITIPCSISFLALSLNFRANIGLDSYTTYNWIMNIMLSVLFYIHIVFYLYIIFKWLKHIQDRYLTALFLGALFSQLFFILVASFNSSLFERVMIILYFSIFALFIRAFADLQFAIPKEKLLAWVLLPIVMMSSVKMAYTTMGYMRNYQTNTYNIEVLHKASEDIKAGMAVEVIELMPSAGFGMNIEHHLDVYAIREFYDLPHSVAAHLICPSVD